MKKEIKKFDCSSKVCKYKNGSRKRVGYKCVKLNCKYLKEIIKK